MITLNGYTIEQGRFPDGTLSLNVGDSIVHDSDSHVTNWIDWFYDGDDEMFTIMSLVDIVKRNSIGRIYLNMPYLPNANIFTHKKFNIYRIKI
jgi:phosphoribosylpyrophosphate synthetase